MNSLITFQTVNDVTNRDHYGHYYQLKPPNSWSRTSSLPPRADVNNNVQNLLLKNRTKKNINYQRD